MKSTSTEYPLGWLVVGFTGIFAIAANVFGDLKWSWEGSPTIWEPNHAIILIVGLGTTAAAYGFSQSVSNWKTSGLYIPLFGIAYLFCFAATFSISFDRLGSQRDDRISAREVKNGKGGKRITRKLLDRANMKTAKFCVVPRSRKLRATYKSQCDYWKDQVAFERKLLARTKVSSKSGDALGYRIARIAEMAGWKIPKKDVGIIVPSFIVIGLIMLGSIAPAWGFAGRKVESEFNFGATGKAAVDEKAKRYITGYRGENGKGPRIEEIMTELDVTHKVAQRYKARYDNSAARKRYKKAA